MDEQATRAAPRYDASIDRAGLALGAGSLAAGAIALILLALGGAGTPLALVGGGLLATLLSAVAIVAVAGPPWLLLHLAGRRRAHHAALTGGIVALLLFVAAQTRSFGLGGGWDDGSGGVRWASALATALFFAIAAAAIGVLMWRIAYRRQREG